MANMGSGKWRSYSGSFAATMVSTGDRIFPIQLIRHQTLMNTTPLFGIFANREQYQIQRLELNRSCCSVESDSMAFKGSNVKPCCMFCAAEWTPSEAIFITSCMHTTCRRCIPSMCNIRSNHNDAPPFPEFIVYFCSP